MSGNLAAEADPVPDAVERSMTDMTPAMRRIVATNPAYARKIIEGLLQDSRTPLVAQLWIMCDALFPHPGIDSRIAAAAVAGALVAVESMPPEAIPQSSPPETL